MNRRQFTKLTLAGVTSLALGNVKSSLAQGNNIINRYKELGSPSLRLLIPKGSEDNIKPIAKQFEAKGLGKIKIDMADVDSLASTIITTTLANKQNFDIALPPTFALPELVQIGALKPLDNFISKYEPSNFSEGLLYSHGNKVNNNSFGYQVDGDCYVMFYNRPMLEDKEHQARFSEQHGFQLKVPDTWEKLDKMIEYFGSLSENQLGGSLFRNRDYVAWEWWLRFHEHRTLPFNDNLEPLIATDAGIKALEDLVNVTQYLDPRTKNDGLFDNWSSFSEGNSFCNIGWGGTQKFLQKKGFKDLSYGKTPGASHFNWGWNFVVGANSNNAEAAYLYSLYSSTPENSATAIAQAGGYFDPFRSEHYTDPRIIEIYSSDFLKVHKESLANAIPDLYLPQRTELWSALSAAIDYALDKKLSPKAALTSAARQWRKILKQEDKETLTKQWISLRSNYPKNYLD